jgi:hypothetical protein
MRGESTKKNGNRETSWVAVEMEKEKGEFGLKLVLFIRVSLLLGTRHQWRAGVKPLGCVSPAKVLGQVLDITQKIVMNHPKVRKEMLRCK